MSTIPFSHVDAFTTVPFRGNPAVVCRIDEWPSGEWMQHVAREMNAGATVFVRLAGDRTELRWFSPAVELVLCGHGTLAAAHLVWETGARPRTQPITFQTKDGVLSARSDGERIVIDFPALPDSAAEAPDGLLAALGIGTASDIRRSRLDYLVEVESEQIVRDLKPDLGRLSTINTRGVMVTARADRDGDFVSRFFAPSAGINEDYATGSAHCCLTVFWTRRLGRPQLVARQLSSRGATLYVELAGDRVHIGGHAITVTHGQLST